MENIFEKIAKPTITHFRIDDAEVLLKRGLKHFIGDDYKWLPEYNEIVEWLSDNKGKGLLCMGNCGRGKTVICLNILSAVLLSALISSVLFSSIYSARTTTSTTQ